MRAPLLAALLCATALRAHAGGIFLPGTFGDGSATPPYTAPTKAQGIVAASGCSFTLGSAPTLNDVLIAECPSAVAGNLSAGWTLIYAYTVSGVSGRTVAAAYHFVVGGDGAGPWTPFTLGVGTNSAAVAFEVGGLSDTVWANHYTAGPRASGSSFANLTATASVASPTLVLGAAVVTATTTVTNGVANITGLSGDFVGVTATAAGAGGATQQLTGTGANATASFTGSGAAAGAGLDLLYMTNP